MVRVTWGWTERHTAVALMLSVSLVASMAGLTEDPRVSFAVVAAVVISALISLALDGFGGAVVGIACAAGLVGLRRLTGHWDEPDFVAALVETLAIVATGVTAGLVGSRLRNLGEARAPSAFEPVYGSLGLFGQDAAMARLSEEVDRAGTNSRPLCLVILDVAVRNPDLSKEGGSAALRAAARIVESRVGDADVPFALAVGRLGVVLPEASPARAWDIVGEILHAVSTARFTFGSERQQRMLADDIEVKVGLAQFGPSLATPEMLLDAALAALVEPSTEAGPR